MLKRRNDITHAPATALWNPASVTVIGASDNPNKVGGRAIHYMQRYGYEGRILPVNPQRAEVQGLPCFASLAQLPEVPEAAIIAVAGDAAADAVRACADMGIATAIVMASGFAETGVQGRALQDDLVRHASASGMRIVGPNAQGIANFASGAVLNFSTMFMEVEPMDGPIAIVSQSGAASVMPYVLLRERGLGVRYLAATGNDADLGVSELALSVATDESIRLILVYVESLSQPAMLAEAARIARKRGARVVLLKGGSSALGAAAAASHTGALAGQDAALDAFLERHGILRARDVHELVNAAALFERGFPVREGRTVVMSHSGAVGVLCADAAERVGLPLASLSEATVASLAQILPGFATAGNPLDLTASLLGNGAMFSKVLDALGRDPQADMFAIGVPVAGPGYDVPDLARTAAHFMASHRNPLVVTAPQRSVRAEFEACGVPTYISETDAIHALWQYAHSDRMHCAAASSLSPEETIVPHGLLDEAASLSLLQRYGVPVVEHAVCANADEAAVIAQTMGEQVVVKGCAAEIPHKSEHGLVHIGVSDARGAAEDCLARLNSLGVREPRVVVARMARGLHEFMLGVTVDPVLGPIVVIGEGGTLVEVRGDVASLLAPFTVDDALAAIRRLRIAPLINGYRGQPPLDADALAKAAVALGHFAMAHRTSLVSVDMNPVMVMARGDGVVVVDAVVQFKEPA
ncbi:acetate--CoA ligase family protein [Paraburkholderia caribensis]|uniref:acetate--CoA ligase family protein n=1 Tax=Paraburkholderia caribensis TaxID=75105 RepID=UPI001CB64AAD|nr:acetate--CoA ligase family protein [Paraburkholderia caribensis]CAG9243638.1 Putative acetyl-CoA synthetase (ADP-forming) alpha and beta chains protein [Paraburkholderia caribensis]